MGFSILDDIYGNFIQEMKLLQTLQREASSNSCSPLQQHQFQWPFFSSKVESAGWLYDARCRFVNMVVTGAVLAVHFMYLCVALTLWRHLQSIILFTYVLKKKLSFKKVILCRINLPNQDRQWNPSYILMMITLSNSLSQLYSSSK